MPRWRVVSLVAFLLIVTVIVASAGGGRKAPAPPAPLGPATIGPVSPPTLAPYRPAAPLTGRCGVERWDVKTGTDTGARSVDATPHPATISQLDALAPPAAPAGRLAPVETTVFQVKAILTDYKVEADRDEHLALLDPNGGGTLIAEIPSPSCVGTSSAFAEAIAMARADFDARFTATGSYRRTSVPVTVTGVGFFDRVHGQRGVAVNGIELHPVLSITFG